MTIAAHSATPGTPNAAVITAVVIAGILLYWLPTIIGSLRRVPALGQVVVWNFFAFFLFVPWIVAMSLAWREPRREPGG